MTEERVTSTQVQHEWPWVREKLAEVGALAVVTKGRVVARMYAPAPDEPQMDQLVETGDAPPDWRDRQARLRTLLAHSPVRTATPDTSNPATAALLADRDETDR